MQSVDYSELVAKTEVKCAVDKMRRVLREALPAGSFAEREAAALAISNEVVRGVLVADLQAISDALGTELLVDGEAYKRHELGTGNYHSLCGVLPVKRHTYRRVGIRNGPTVIPLELVAGLAEGATPALAYNVAHGYAQHDTRVHEETLRTSHRVPPSRATLERIAQDIGKATVAAVARIEPLVRRAEKVPQGAVAVVMGLDRTAVAMIEDRPPDAPPKPEPKRRKPRVRKPPAPFDINWRMAYVGTVSLVDAIGETLEVRRYAAPACDDPRELVKQMTADVRRALRQNPALNAGIVQDGAHEMWDRTREGMQALREQGVLECWYEGIDRYHLLERLGKALEIVEPSGDERRRQLDAWHAGFDQRNATIDEIDHFFTDHYRRLFAAGDTTRCEQLWEHLRYIGNHKGRMRYVSLRNAGLPVGSGVTESSAKTVIGQRAKGSGQRWREEGLRGAITLRALDQSDRLPRFWAFLSRRYTALVQAA
jgi:hypothetical protein